MLAASRRHETANGRPRVSRTSLILKRPPDRADADSVFFSQFGDRGPFTVPIGDDTLLASVEALRTPKLLALALSPLDSRIGATADQTALKLRNAAHYGQHQPADIGCRVAPAFPKR